MDLPDDEPWPPVPPDVEYATMKFVTPELAVTANSMLYKIEGDPSKVYKDRAGGREYGLAVGNTGWRSGIRAGGREYGLQKAAEECAIPVRGRVLRKPGVYVYVEGFMMDLATPIPQLVPPPQHRDIMHQMICTVQALHDKKRIIHGDIKPENMLLDSHGKLRLCDFAEGRYVDEDERVWNGLSTWHYESPSRLLRSERYQRELAPPTIEDDLYALGLSIWQLYTGKIPQEDIAGDDVALKERQRESGTVNVAEVHDQEGS